jgi:uncharacterized protein (TIGR02246 family)
MSGFIAKFDHALTAFNRPFAAGDAEPFVGLFAEDVRVLLHEHPALVGRAHIGQMFIELFTTVDTAGFEVDHDIVDFHDDACVLATFRETLRPKDSAPRIRRRCAAGVLLAERGRWHLPGESTTHRPSLPDRILS